MAADKDAMLANLRELHSGQRKRSKKPLEPAERKLKKAQLAPPSFEPVKMAMAAGETLGIESPYYRVAEAIDGTRIKIDGNWCANFSSYDYLGLNRDSRITSAVAEAARTWGVSSTASRLAGGERGFHGALDRALAQFLGHEDCLVMVSGHATNQAVIRTLVEPGDLVLVDALSHNSIYEGVRASGAKHLSFPHNDFAWVDARLRETRSAYKRVLIVVEGLYSMDGDMPDLSAFVEVKHRHEALLMVDEAHSIGVLGATGRGACEEQGVDPRDIDVVMGTLSKSLCACGGFIAGSKELIEVMKFLAPGFVYSVGLSSPNAAAALSALAVLDEEPERVQMLRKLGQEFKEGCLSAGLDVGHNQGFAVGPVVVGDSLRATKLSNDLLSKGLHVIPVIFPGVPEKAARLRFFITAAHTSDDISQAIDLTVASLKSL